MKNINTYILLFISLFSCNESKQNTYNLIENEDKTFLRFESNDAQFVSDKALKLNQKAIDAVRDQDYSLAIKFALRALSNEPENLIILNNLGIIFLERQKFDSALLFLEKALKLNSSHAITYVNLAATSNKLEHYDKSIMYSSIAIKKSSTDYEKSGAFLNRAMAYGHLANYEKAILDIDSAIALSEHPEKFSQQRQILHQLYSSQSLDSLLIE